VSPALRLLVFLAVRARYRRIARGLLTVKGALLMLLGLGFFSLSIFGPIYTRSLHPADFPAAASPAANPLQRFGPAGLLAFTFLSLFASTRFRGVYFSPAEVDFLFSGPFSRRELIAYRLTTQLIHTFLSVLITSAFLFAYLRGFWQTAVGLFLAFTFINLVQIAASLIAGSLEERVVARGRKFILIVLAGLALLVFAGSTSLIRGGAEFRQSVKDLLGSREFGWALLPLKTFSETLTARTLSGFLAWGAGAAATNLALLVLVLRLDVDYSEASLETSRRVHQRLQQAKRGGRLMVSGSRLRLGLPLPRGWSGALAVAWRQGQEMVREMPGAVYLLAALAAGVLAPLLFFAEHEGLDTSAARSFGWLAAVMPFLLSNWFRFDFRGDLDRMEVLLGLPLSSAEVALGQLLVPTLLLSGLQAGALGLVLAGLVEPAERQFLQFALLLCLPFNLLFVAIENFTFLLYPVRIAPAAPGDFQAMGRLLLGFVVKMAVLLGVLLLGGSLGYLVQLLTGSNLLAVTAGGAFLILTDLAAIRLVGWAFARFDVSRPPPE
jgi:putative ABC exporter